MVMATGREITLDDLPTELKLEKGKQNDGSSWEIFLQQEIQQRLENGETQILDKITPLFEAAALKQH
jgi:hypothetical protein